MDNILQFEEIDAAITVIYQCDYDVYEMFEQIKKCETVDFDIFKRLLFDMDFDDAWAIISELRNKISENDSIEKAFEAIIMDKNSHKFYNLIWRGF